MDRRGKMAAIMGVEGEVVKVAMIAVGVGGMLVVDIEVVTVIVVMMAGIAVSIGDEVMIGGFR